MPASSVLLGNDGLYFRQSFFFHSAFGVYSSSLYPFRSSLFPCTGTNILYLSGPVPGFNMSSSKHSTPVFNITLNDTILFGASSFSSYSLIIGLHSVGLFFASSGEQGTSTGLSVPSSSAHSVGFVTLTPPLCPFVQCPLKSRFCITCAFRCSALLLPKHGVRKFRVPLLPCMCMYMSIFSTSEPALANLCRGASMDLLNSALRRFMVFVRKSLSVSSSIFCTNPDSPCSSACATHMNSRVDSGSMCVRKLSENFSGMRKLSQYRSAL